MEEFIRLPADELLKQFAAGGHKPGSGSAAAFQGMLAASLTQTVIKLTADHYGPDTFAETRPSASTRSTPS